MSGVAGLLNKGFIVARASRNSDGIGSAEHGGRTIIVTGLRRSGTSLIAAMLRQAGIFMGSEINDGVHEDEEIARIVATRDTKALRRLIRDRDANYGTWGFKLPMLGVDLEPARIALFNNPHLIVPFRDPIAISLRNSLSDFQEPMQALHASLHEQEALVSFVARLACPVLLLSYEKMLTVPGDLVEAVMQFCGILDNEALRNRLVGLVEPNKPDYIAMARRRYDGIIDGVANGHLYGWCHLTASPDPVSLDLFIDNVAVCTFRADAFRQDLKAAGIGDGHHGFAVDVRAFDPRPDAVIRIKVSQHGVELDNSNRPFGEYRAWT